jgi:hypothetical protein
MDNDRSNDRRRSTDAGGPSTEGAVDETEREVIMSGTAATSEVGDPAAQERARRLPGRTAKPADADAAREDREERAPEA